MAEVRPFFGLRYDPEVAGDVGRLLTPPFDVISPPDQAMFHAQSEHNIIRLELGQEQPGDSAQSNKYTRAGAFLQDWLARGVLRRDGRPAFYVYDQFFAFPEGVEQRRRGIVGAVRLEEWDKRVVLPHEETMAGPKADRLALMRACRANLSPIFGLFEDAGDIADLLASATVAAPLMDARTADGERHRLWSVDDPLLLKRIEGTFAPLPIYIADGHHRYETALAYRNERRLQEPGSPADAAFNYVMMVLVAMSDPGLVVLPTHRMVREAPAGTSGLADRFHTLFTLEARTLDRDVEQALRDVLDEMARRGRQAPTFGVAGLEKGVFHLLALKDESALAALMPAGRGRAWQKLDVSILQVAILQHLLGLPEVKGREDLTYTRDAVQAWTAVRQGERQLAFFLNPTGVTEMRDVADADDRMPPKSTYFHPKLPTGLVLNPLD